MSWHRSIAMVVLLCGCGGSDSGVEAVTAAKEQVRAGDLQGGLKAMEAAHAEHSGSVEAAVGASWTAYLKGRFDEADAILAAVEGSAGEAQGEIILRRAMVALAARNLDQVRTLGEASGTPAGRLLAAEVALADGERDVAREHLQAAVESGDHRVSTTARDYLSLIGDDDPRVQGLSEAQALWALGEERVAVRAVEELLKSFPEEYDERSSLLLLWAGRAASAGEPQVASNLLESIGFPPPGQQWRVIATRALVACAEGDVQKCSDILDSLESAAPQKGLEHARATAAVLLAPTDAEAAIKIAGPTPNPAVARALMEAGLEDDAARYVTAGPIHKHLETGG